MEEKIKMIADNRKASFDYFLLDRYEAGIELKGTEVKSLRKNSCSIKDAYVVVRGQEAFVLNMNIAVYEKGNIFNHEPLRDRKLLLHKNEIAKLGARVKEEGLTIVPTKIYFKKGRAKLEIALAKGKKRFDKRDDAKQKSIKKEIRKASKEVY